MFDLTDAQIEGFAKYKASYLPSLIGTNAAFLQAIREHVGDIVGLAAPEACARRQDFFKFDIPATEFRERVLYEDFERVVLGGIRFKCRDPKFPFVELNANFHLFTPLILAEFAELARESFHAFAPKGILMTGSPHAAVSATTERWSSVLCGPTTVLSSRGLPAELACTFPTHVDFYETYRSAYEAWQTTSPNLRGFVRAESHEDLEASAAQGCLASLEDANGWCGVVAAREEALYGTQALYIFEIFLTERWRGRRVALALDAALVSHAARRFPLVWENIHAENWPSLRVALAQGRTIVETEYFIPWED